jgi:hypothetical protein
MSTNSDQLDRCNHFAETLKADSRLILDRYGIPATPNFVNRVVMRYVKRVAHTGFPFAPWLVSQIQLTAEQRRRATADPQLAYMLSYADPVGETAINNVLKGRT